MKEAKLFDPVEQSNDSAQYLLLGYRQKLLGALLVMSILVAVGALTINLIDWIKDPSMEWGTYNLISDAVAIAIVLALYWANQKGLVSLSGWLFSLTVIVAVPICYPLAAINEAFLVMGLPIALASFVIQPWASFLWAGLVALFYTVTFLNHPRAFDYDIFSLLTLFFMAVGSYLISSILNKAISDTVRAYDETIRGWANALEMRDSETMGHSQRIIELTLALARKVGVKDADLVHVRRGALLHDIGKMGIPDAILHKPGKLTEEEWKIMRKHPVYARSYLATISYLAPALDIPYSHHERWDGTGYPRGLKGDEIPLSARIFAVVDVWDALTMQRPYRGAWSPEKALTHIQEQAGKHFDPRIVESFVELIKKQKRI